MCFMETYVVCVLRNRVGRGPDVAKRNPGELAVRAREPGLCCSLSKLRLLTLRNWVHKWQSYIATTDVDDARTSFIALESAGARSGTRCPLRHIVVASLLRRPNIAGGDMLAPYHGRFALTASGRRNKALTFLLNPRTSI